MKGKEDYDKCKDKREYTSSKHKSRGRKLCKEACKTQFRKTAKAQEHAFLDSLSDLKKDSTSSDDESEHKIKDKLNGLCFHTNTAKKGFCVMALDN
jgi:hypothetical protein